MADEQKNIIISVSVDNTDAVAGIDEVKNKLDDVSDTPLDKPFKNFKQQIKDATLEAQKLEQQFGKNSTEFKNAAKQLASLKDANDEFGQSIKSFNPDNKLTALTSAARGAVGAVQGVTGAMQFLGVESDDAQQAIARLQGLMAFGDALDSIDDIKNAYSNFTNIIKDAAIVQKTLNYIQEGSFKTNAELLALKEADIVVTEGQTVATEGLAVAEVGAANAAKLLRTAFVATGIGVLILLLGTLYTAMTSASDATEKEKKSTDALKKSVDDLSESFEKQKRIRQEELDLQILRAQAEGKSAADIRKLREDSNTEAQKTTQNNINELKNTIKNNEIQGQSNTQLYKDKIVRLGVYQTELTKLEKEGERIRLQNKIDADNELKKVEEKPKPKTKAEVKEDPRIQAEKDYQEQLKELRDQNFLSTIEDEDLAKKIILKNEFDKQEGILKEKYKGVENEQKLNTLLTELRDKLNVDLANVDEAARLREEENQQKIREKRLDFDKETEELRKQNKYASMQSGIEKELLILEDNFSKEKTALQKLLDDKIILEEEYQARLKEITEKNAREKNDIEKKWSDLSAKQRINTAVELGDALINIAGAYATFQKDKAGDDKRAQIRSVKVQEAVTIGGILMSTTKTVMKDAEKGFPLAIPFIAADIALGGLQAATAISSSKKAIAQINAAEPAGGSGGGGGGTTPQITAPTINATATAPQAIQDVRVTNQGQQPIRAFITDRDLRSNEQKNNFLNNLSTF
jgi:hypothetical protein